ncbi:hypothetical protein HDU83_009198 [Entophlyctis luteolus]|nr:hypothetical protein HDU83_009198 [Entophlyctis luteolus]
MDKKLSPEQQLHQQQRQYYDQMQSLYSQYNTHSLQYNAAPLPRGSFELSPEEEKEALRLSSSFGPGTYHACAAVVRLQTSATAHRLMADNLQAQADLMLGWLSKIRGAVEPSLSGNSVGSATLASEAAPDQSPLREEGGALGNYYPQRTGTADRLEASPKAPHPLSNANAESTLQQPTFPPTSPIPTASDSAVSLVPNLVPPSPSAHNPSNAVHAAVKVSDVGDGGDVIRTRSDSLPRHQKENGLKQITQPLSLSSQPLPPSSPTSSVAYSPSSNLTLRARAYSASTAGSKNSGGSSSPSGKPKLATSASTTWLGSNSSDRGLKTKSRNRHSIAESSSVESRFQPLPMLPQPARIQNIMPSLTYADFLSQQLQVQQKKRGEMSTGKVSKSSPSPSASQSVPQTNTPPPIPRPLRPIAPVSAHLSQSGQVTQSESLFFAPQPVRRRASLIVKELYNNLQEFSAAMSDDDGKKSLEVNGSTVYIRARKDSLPKFSMIFPPSIDKVQVDRRESGKGYEGDVDEVLYADGNCENSVQDVAVDDVDERKREFMGKLADFFGERREDSVGGVPKERDRTAGVSGGRKVADGCSAVSGSRVRNSSGTSLPSLLSAEAPLEMKKVGTSALSGFLSSSKPPIMNTAPPDDALDALALEHLSIHSQKDAIEWLVIQYGIALKFGVSKTIDSALTTCIK